MKYIDEIKKAMKLLSDNDYYILGQSTKFKGTGLYWSLEDTFPINKRIETPILEDTQMGLSTGMNMAGLNICSIYPRIDFLICAMSQLALHLDKIEEMSDGQFKPKIIIRTAIGSIKPLFPGPQHNNDYTEALRLMCKNIDIIKLEDKQDIMTEYTKALKSERSSLIIEIPDLYET